MCNTDIQPQVKALPELLCPVGSKEALKAAIAGGADAIYMGGASFHARMKAQLFSQEDLIEAIKLAHAYGVKVYITMNTLVTDHEMKPWLEAAYDSYNAGADGLIIDDMGAAFELHQNLPYFPLHASTQMTVHNSNAGQMLKDLGYSRMVVARETSLFDLQTICKRSPIEIEAFVHGALCVCHSGQCLFSSMIGGRSGNRGLCAQPCRLPYNVGGKTAYPLSLKDLTLSQHVPELIETGVASLKIEGRMKSPEYVYTTAKIWRHLLDSRSSASAKELQEMADAFSREGFTDAYWTGQVKTGKAHAMLGIRTENNKNETARVTPFEGLNRKIAVNMSFSMHENKPMQLTVSTDSGLTVTAEGATPEIARNAPLSRSDIEKQLSKLGGTVYSLSSLNYDMSDNLMVPVSSLNALRREALSNLDSLQSPQNHASKDSLHIVHSGGLPASCDSTAYMYDSQQITPKASSAFSVIYLPLWKYNGESNGVALPPVIFDSEQPAIEKMLQKAKDLGAKHLLVSNPWHLPFVQKYGFTIHADYRFNVMNRESAAVWNRQGFSDVILSPELTLPQCRDIQPGGRVIVYGRIPLMTLEKCLGKEIGNCEKCAEGKNELIDRTRTAFPVIREWEHRSLVCNSKITWVADQLDSLTKANIRSKHFIFTNESPKEVDSVILAYQRGEKCLKPFRRIGVTFQET